MKKLNKESKKKKKKKIKEEVVVVLSRVRHVAGLGACVEREGQGQRRRCIRPSISSIGRCRARMAQQEMATHVRKELGKG